MTQAVLTPSIVDRVRAILSNLGPMEEPGAELPRLTSSERRTLHQLADCGDAVLRNCASAGDAELARDAEALVVEPLRQLYRAIAGKRAALDMRRVDRALEELDCAVGSLAERLIDRADAEDGFEEGLQQLRASADGRKIALDPEL